VAIGGDPKYDPKTTSCVVEQMKRLFDRILMDGFVLEGTITLVHIIEDGVQNTVSGSKLVAENSQEFELEVMHSVYTRTAALF